METTNNTITTTTAAPAKPARRPTAFKALPTRMHAAILSFLSPRSQASMTQAVAAKGGEEAAPPTVVGQIA